MENEIKEVFKDFPANITAVVTELLPGSVIVRSGFARNFQPFSRFRVGGKAEKRLNRVRVEESLAEHFVWYSVQVEKF